MSDEGNIIETVGVLESAIELVERKGAQRKKGTMKSAEYKRRRKP